MRILKTTVVACAATLALGACSSSDVTEATDTAKSAASSLGSEAQDKAASATDEAKSATESSSPAESSDAAGSSAAPSTSSSAAPSTGAAGAAGRPSTAELCAALQKHGGDVFGKALEKTKGAQERPGQCQLQVAGDPSRRLALMASSAPFDQMVKGLSSGTNPPKVGDAAGGPPKAKTIGDDESKPSNVGPGEPKYAFGVAWPGKDDGTWMLVAGDDEPSQYEDELIAAAKKIHDDNS